MRLGPHPSHTPFSPTSLLSRRGLPNTHFSNRLAYSLRSSPSAIHQIGKRSIDLSSLMPAVTESTCTPKPLKSQADKKYRSYKLDLLYSRSERTQRFKWCLDELLTIFLS